MTDKPKYKQTEVGLIPSDWEVKKIKDFAKVYDGTHQTPHYVNFGVQFYSVENVTANDFVHTKFISEQEHKQLSARVKIEKGDILMTRIGSIGDCKYVNWSPKASFYVSLALIKCNKSVCPQFISYYSNSAQFKKELELRSLLTAIPQKINLGPISEIILCLPTFEEQKRIAQALSDVDAVISTTEKLIAKKKALKQGTMQTLLSGKMRIQNGKWIKTTNFKQTELGPIPQEWEVKSLGSITQNSSYGVGAEAIPFNGKAKYIRITDIDDDSHRFEPSPLTSPAFYENKHLVQENDLLIARTGASVGKTYLYNAKDGKLVFAGFLIKMNICGADSKFVFYSTLTKYYQDWIVSESARTGQPGVNLQQMKKLLIAIPSSKAEQTAIATVLSNMDSEITTLETKLAKYRQLKTGMMQQLLTGKVRLVDSAETASENQSKHSVPLSFKRSVLAAEIADRLCDEPTFGHVKMEKMLFLTEKMCNIDIDSSYHRDAAGPFDNRGLHSVDSQLAKQKWFKAVKQDKGYRYAPLEKRGGHKQYFERYFSDSLSVFNNIINIFKTANTEQCEIVATLYSAWEDFLKQGISPTDEQIVTEVLTNWHKSKERIPKERWLKALLWMKEHEFIPEVGEKIK